MRDLGSVLSVEDEEIDQRQIHRVMQRSGRVSDLRAFYSADAAVAWIQGAPEAPLDVVLLDINMPRMDGYAFLDLISNDLVKRKVSVFIMLTAEVSPDNAARLREQACVRGFLEKPLTTDHLDQIASKLGVVSPV